MTMVLFLEFYGVVNWIYVVHIAAHGTNGDNMSNTKTT